MRGAGIEPAAAMPGPDSCVAPRPPRAESSREEPARSCCRLLTASGEASDLGKDEANTCLAALEQEIVCYGVPFRVDRGAGQKLLGVGMMEK